MMMLQMLIEINDSLIFNHRDGRMIPKEGNVFQGGSITNTKQMIIYPDGYQHLE
jgi:hypothetical protein